MPSTNGTTPEAAVPGADPAAPRDAAEQSAIALDAYSRTVIGVAEALSASVANLQVRRRTRRGQAMGAGSGVAISADGFVITSAHVVEGTRHGVASFSDGHETPVSRGGLGPAVGPRRPARRRRRPDAGHPRRRRRPARGPARGGHRQPQRLCQLGHRGRRQRPRPLAPRRRPRRAAPGGGERHPDRRGAQPRQLRRRAGRRRRAAWSASTPRWPASGWGSPCPSTTPPG